jgi:hypothetical protein
MADHRRKARGEEKRLSLVKKTRFTPGRSGFCEAQLWEFTATSGFLPDQEPAVERIAAESLDEALKFMRRKYPEFRIVKAVALGTIAILAGSPLD